MRTAFLLLLGIAAACIANASYADEKVAVVVPALIDPRASSGEAIMRACSLDAKVGTQVFERVSERYPGTERIQNPSEAGPQKTVVKVTLVSVVVTRGAMWTTGRALNIRAEIMRDANVIGSHSLSRTSFALGETCEVMDRIAAVLARDIAAWLSAGLMAPKYSAPAASPPAAEPQKAEGN